MGKKIINGEFVIVMSESGDQFIIPRNKIDIWYKNNNDTADWAFYYTPTGINITEFELND